MTRTVKIPIAALTPDSFAPFGQIIGAPLGEPDFRQSHIASWRLSFDSAGPIELMFSRYMHQPMRFGQLERHFDVTQSFIALGGAGSVMVVAAPNPADDEESAMPQTSDIRAFYVDGARGIMLWRRTWHALTRFPTAPPGADFALITDTKTQQELQRQDREGVPPRLTQVVDYGDRFGIDFLVVDPEGHSAPRPVPETDSR